MIEVCLPNLRGGGIVAVSAKPTSPFELAVRDLPRELRAEQGSERITAWCPTCQERAVPMRNGTCAFCETVIVTPPANGNGHAPGGIPTTFPQHAGGIRPAASDAANKGDSDAARIPAVYEQDAGNMLDPAGGGLRLGENLMLPLARATALSIGPLRRLLHTLADEGVARMEGSRGGARWMLDGWEPEEAVAPELAAPTPQTPEAAAAVTAARRLVDARGLAEDALEQLDGVLESGGLTLLRGRYIAALLARIEAGDPDPTLLDRFERAAGFSA